MNNGRTRFAIIIVVALGLVAGAVLGVHDLRWRAQVIAKKAVGGIEGVTWAELLEMLAPSSPVNLEPLRTTPNAYAAIVNPYTTDGDRENGARLFQVWCAACHGAEGSGQTAPTLIGRALKAGDSDWSLYRTITQGRMDLGMPPVPIDGQEAWQIVGHVRTLRNGSAPTDERADDRQRLEAVAVPAARIESAAAEPHNWLTYSGGFDSWRYTRLDEITPDNVAELRLAWTLQLGTQEEYLETTPLVVDGIMYLSAPDTVLAIDASAGRVLWRHTRSAPRDVPLCCGRVNRGVALLDDRVYVGTIDGYLLALDAKTGRQVWETKIADYKDGYSVTAAPLAVRDKIVVGISGGEFGIRGFLDAYDAVTGKLAWRFNTIPEPGRPGSETWTGDAWKTGGGPTWVTGSFDPQLGLLYWGVGNPSPDFNGDVRPGDNLYTNSVVALDIESGELKWHFQFTPHDEHDWDSNQVPLLVDHDIAGARRRLMLWANRNGFYYVLDRETGEYLAAAPFVTQNWAESIDAAGRPVLRPAASPSKLGVLTWPGLSGGANWWSPAYSPQNDLVYVPFADAPKVYFKNAEIDAEERLPNVQFMGSASVHTGEPLKAGIRALDPLTGKVVWEYLRRQPQRNVGYIGGVLATAGNVAFFGDLSEFVAFDAKAGREAWRVNLGGNINASPMSFAIDGRQHVAIPAGNALFVFRL
jgi:alcohol dehydrogenase (cytochrome c)